jgi:PepB aminopeptidase
MTRFFEVSLSSDLIDPIWGADSHLVFASSGATIHLADLSDSIDNVEKIQQCARSISKMKVTNIRLTGTWSIEAQWHFWQGAYDTKKTPNIEFATLSDEQVLELQNRISTYTWVKQIINQTPEELSPYNLAILAAQFLSKLAPEQITHKIISGEELAKQGYVGIYGVGRGSDRPPAFLELDFCPDGWGDEPPAAALVGKGITFDTGGYSMKSSLGMLNMKADMGGAATVTGALALSILNGLDKRVKLYLCCAENMISGHAYQLSDILKYRNGVSVEVVNTDAEGRIVLADGLIDASASKAPIIIDAATVTGAAVTAVGDEYNALFCMNNELAQTFDRIASDEYDQTWRLPLSNKHMHKCPSDYADTANSRPVPGGGSGGASNAAGFLSRFVDNTDGWIHLDLAACFNSSANSLHSAGGNGRGVRSIAAFLNQL